MSAAKGDHALKRDQFSAVWGHKDPLPESVKPHVADEHESGAGGWRCYDCGEKVVLVSSGLTAVPVEQPVR